MSSTTASRALLDPSPQSLAPRLYSLLHSFTFSPLFFTLHFSLVVCSLFTAQREPAHIGYQIPPLSVRNDMNPFNMTVFYCNRKCFLNHIPC
jgi:hypothetical protein